MLQGLQHQHLNLTDQQLLYPHLNLVMQQPDSDSELLESINERLLKIKEEISFTQDPRKLAKKRISQNHLLTEKKILELFEIESKQQLQTKLEELLNLLPNKSVFRLDVKACLDIFKKPIDTPQIYTVTDDASANDIFLLGEINASCQGIVNGNPYLNVGLLGYLLDGKHRFLLVKNSEGKILARCVMRLLVDDQGKPVLYQEDLYTVDNNPNYAIYLRQLAINKAKKLDIPLLTGRNNNDIQQQNKIFSSSIHTLNQPIFAEYVDALKKIVYSIYSLEDVVQINIQK